MAFGVHYFRNVAHRQTSTQVAYFKNFLLCVSRAAVASLLVPRAAPSSPHTGPVYRRRGAPARTPPSQAQPGRPHARYARAS